jgi:hypothetical protein
MVYIPSINTSEDIDRFNTRVTDPALKNTFISRLPIKKIKHPLLYPNALDIERAERIAKDFHADAWEAVWVDQNFFLREGQHRLKAASLMNLKFIDVIIVPWELHEKVYVYRGDKAYTYSAQEYGRRVELQPVIQ